MEQRYTAYQLPMLAAPAAIHEAFHRGPTAGDFPPISEAFALLAGSKPCANEVRRARDGRLLVTCTTELPAITPAMVDWWFGWHLPETQRYRLWHPLAHVAAVVEEDRTAWPDIKSRYIGNVSYVDEYIGATLNKLAIAFKPPAEFGFAQNDAGYSTTICAATSDRSSKIQSGWLVHHVVSTPDGAQMRSGFWLGDFKPASRWPRTIAGTLLNTSFVRRRVLTDRMGLDLLLHCGEEMNHLPRFLPQLYREFGPGRAA